jgi:hypothetical protein
MRNFEMSNEVLEKLAEFVKEWRNAASIEGVELQDIQVNLASVLTDVCDLAEVNPELIGLLEKELA